MIVTPGSLELGIERRIAVAVTWYHEHFNWMWKFAPWASLQKYLEDLVIAGIRIGGWALLDRRPSPVL